MNQTLRNSQSTYQWTQSDFSILNSGYIPWTHWQPGFNVVIEKSAQSLKILELKSSVITSASESQWSQSDSFILESFSIQPEYQFQHLSIINSEIYNIWILKHITDPFTFLKKIKTLPAPQNENDFLQHKIAWIAYWENLILMDFSENTELIDILGNYFHFLTQLNPTDFSIHSFGVNQRYTANLCDESQLIQWLNEKNPTASWIALEKNFLTAKPFPAVLNSFCKQYLTIPTPHVLSGIQNLNRDFLQFVYNDWQKNANLSTDMNQYAWLNLKKILTD